MGQRITKSEMSSHKALVLNLFDERELDHLHKLYHTYAPQGKMNLLEFKQYIDSLKIIKRSQRSETYDQLFRGFDVDGDKFVSFEDYLLYHLAVVYGGRDFGREGTFVVDVVSNEGAAPEPPVAAGESNALELEPSPMMVKKSRKNYDHLKTVLANIVFAMCDVDSTSTITYDGLHKVVTNAVRWSGQDMESLTVQSVITQTVTQLMNVMDHDKDGKVQREDFNKCILKHPQILEKLKEAVGLV